MKILVTGSRGLLGSAVCDLAKVEFDVLRPSRSELDLYDLGATKAFLELERPDVVIHAAASVFGLGGHKLHPSHALLANSRIDVNLISALHAFPVKKFIYIGTVASYGYPYNGNHLNEKDFLRGLPHSSEYGYAMAKRFGFDLTNSLIEIGTETNYVAMTNLFGPGDNFNSKTGHVIPSLISRGVQASRLGETLEVWGNPTDTRDFMYSYSAAKRILQLIPTNELSLVNIATGVERSINMVVEILVNHLGIKAVKYSPSSFPSISHRVSDISSLISICGTQREDFVDQIKSTIDWYMENEDAARK